MKNHLEKELIVEIDTNAGIANLKQDNGVVQVHKLTIIEEYNRNKIISKFIDGKLISRNEIDTSTSTVLRERSFNNGIKTGDCIERYRESGRIKCKYTCSDSQPTGLEEGWYDIEGSPIEYRQPYKNGVLDGISTHWYPNGNVLSRCNYVNGKQEGLEQEWYMSGAERSRYTYKNGHRDGISERFYESGTIQIRWKDVEGRCTEETFFRPDGRVVCCSKWIFVNGKQPCLLSKSGFYPNGSVRYTKSYVNGKLDDKVVYNYSTGKLKATQTFKEGISVTPYTRWDEAGNVVCSFNCKNGFEIEFNDEYEYTDEGDSDFDNDIDF